MNFYKNLTTFFKNPLYFYCVDNGACLRQQSTVSSPFKTITIIQY